MEQVVVRGIAVDKDQAKLTLQALPDQPGVAAALFKGLSEGNINVDMIIQNVSTDGKTDLSFTVPKVDLNRAEILVKGLVADIGAGGYTLKSDVAKVSIVGVGMRTHVGIAHKAFTCLAENDINIHMISTSEIKISVLLDQAVADQAVKVLHAAFELDQA
jgi:aspartate kinase